MASARPHLDKLRLDMAIALYEKRTHKKISHLVSRKLSTISSDSIILISSGGDLISRVSLAEIDESTKELQRHSGSDQFDSAPIILNITEINLGIVDKAAQQELIRKHFPPNWCKENLVVPIKIEIPEAGPVLIVGICNSAYVRTIDSILRKRLDGKFLAIKYVVVDYEYPLTTIDEFHKKYQDPKPLSPDRQKLDAAQRKPTEIALSRDPLQSVSDNTQNTNNPDFINLDQLLPSDQKIRLMLSGAGITAFGLFMPALKAPMLGSITYLHDGRGDGILVLICTAMATFFLLNKKLLSARHLSCASMVVQFATISAFYQKKSAIQNDLDSSLSGNPFRGLADAALSGLSLEWAWFFLIGGTIITIGASLLVADSNGNRLRLPRHCIYPHKGLYRENLLLLLGLPLVAGWFLGLAIGR